MSTPRPSTGSGRWLAWLLAFLALEVPAAVRGDGATLSENAWNWFSVRERRRFWLARRLILGAFMAVLSAHFLTGGAYAWTGGAAVIVAGAPVGVVVLLSALFERRKGAAMGGLVAKLLKPLLVKTLKGNWGRLLPLLLKAVAEGELGEPAKRVYWWMAGKKTFTGVVILGASAGLEAVCASHGIQGACDAAHWLYLAGAALTAIGLVDGGTRSPWPTGTAKDLPSGLASKA